MKDLNEKLNKMTQENENLTEINAKLETEIDRLGRELLTTMTEEDNRFYEENKKKMEEDNIQLKGELTTMMDENSKFKEMITKLESRAEQLDGEVNAWTEETKKTVQENNS